MLAFAPEPSPRLLLIVSEGRPARSPKVLTDRLPAGTRIASGLSAGLKLLGDDRPDVVVFAPAADDLNATESIALLGECLSDTPLLVICEEPPAQELREVAVEGAHQLLLAGLTESEEFEKAFSQALMTAAVHRDAVLADARFKRLYENSIAGILSFNAHGDFLSGNPAALALLGFRGEQSLLQANFVDDVCANRRVAEELLRCLRDTGSIRNAELELRSINNRDLTVLLCANSVLNNVGEIDCIEATLIDVSERKKAQDELTYLAKFDRLTGLANRYLFKEALSKELARASRNDTSVSLVMIDLDRFKEINDTLGHDAGDGLLRAVATRLRRCTRQCDTVARLGGDEFAVLIENPGAKLDAITAVVGKILHNLAEPYQINGHEVITTPSIGIATSPEAGQHGDALLKSADIAMYRAKAEGRNRFVFYSDSLHREVLQRVALEKNIREAVEHLDFALAYQPKVRLETGEIFELEALLRWQCPDRGPVSPAEFVPVLERTGLINPIGNWIITSATNQLRKWQLALNKPSLGVSINLSVRQLTQHQLLIDHIANTLDQTGVEPSCIEFEITESSLMHNPERCIETLEGLRKLGVRVSIDDFGTGFSSLQYLKTLPIHGIKIDRTFVRDIPAKTNDVSIIRATIALARSLELTVTAEGIETDEQVAILKALKCDIGQGFYYARPIDPDDVPQILGIPSDELPAFTARHAIQNNIPKDEPVPEFSDSFDQTISLKLPYFAEQGNKH